MVQLDSVNVLARAHELVFFARVGAHDVESLRHWMWRSRDMVEGWVHVASMVPMDAEPLHRFRQHARREDPGAWLQQVTDAMPGYLERVRQEVEQDGPLRTQDLSDPGDRTEGMWGWSPGRKVLHHLFSTGRIAIHERGADFVPWYTAVEDVVPSRVRDRPDVPRDEAYDRLFTALDWLEDRLSTRQFLMGDRLTESDVRLWTTLARFDAVYHGHFKCNRQKLVEMPHLWRYAKELYAVPAFANATDFDQIKSHYYEVHTDINPTGIVPKGPDLSVWTS